MAAMNDKPLTRLFLVDLLSQALLALCVGLAAGIVFAGMALLLAGGA